MENPWSEVDATAWSKHLDASRWFDYQHLAEYETETARLKGGRSIFLRHVAGWGVAVRLTKVAGGRLTIAYVPAGLSIKESAGNPETMIEAIRSLDEHLAGHHRAVLAIRFPALMLHRCQGMETAAATAGLARVARDPRRWTIVLPIDRSDDEVLANFHTKWRYSLKQGLKSTLEIDRESRPEGCDRLQEMLSALMDRKDFDVDQDATFYRRCTELLEQERLVIFGARRPGASDWCSAILVSRQGDAGTYLLGASTPEGLNAQAPSVLQWSAIRWLRDRGCDAYDLGGVDWHRNPQVYTFKKRMNGVATVSSPTMVSRRGVLRSRLCRLAFELKS